MKQIVFENVNGEIQAIITDPTNMLIYKSGENYGYYQIVFKPSVQDLYYCIRPRDNASLQYMMQVVSQFIDGGAVSNIPTNAFTLVANDTAAETAKATASVNALIGTSDLGKLYKVKERGAYTLTEQEITFSNGKTFKRDISNIVMVYEESSQSSIDLENYINDDKILTNDNHLFKVVVIDDVKTLLELTPSSTENYKVINYNTIYYWKNNVFNQYPNQSYGYIYYFTDPITEQLDYTLFNDAQTDYVDYISTSESSNTEWMSAYESSHSNGTQAYFETDNKIKKLTKGETNTWSDAIITTDNRIFAEHKTNNVIDKVAFAWWWSDSSTYRYITSIDHSNITQVDGIKTVYSQSDRQSLSISDNLNKYFLSYGNRVLYKCVSTTEKYLDVEPVDGNKMYSFDSKIYSHLNGLWQESKTLMNKGFTAGSSSPAYDVDILYLQLVNY